jgi:hypothetical protein
MGAGPVVPGAQRGAAGMMEGTGLLQRTAAAAAMLGECQSGAEVAGHQRQELP